MKSVWIDEWLIAPLVPLLGRELQGARRRSTGSPCRERCATRRSRRRACRRRRSRCGRRGTAVDERDLAEASRAVVGRDVGAHELLARHRPDLDRTPAGEADLEAADDRPLELERAASTRTVPSTRRASGAANTSSVGMFATCSIPCDSSRAAVPDRARSAARPSGRCPARGSGARRTPLVQAAARRARSAMCSRQAATGSGSSRRTAVADRLPEPLDVGLAEDGPRPALVREGDDRPVAAPVGQRQARLGELAHARPARRGRRRGRRRARAPGCR